MLVKARKWNKFQTVEFKHKEHKNRNGFFLLLLKAQCHIVYEALSYVKI